jgi:RNA polymerase sigma factor (sigma-70 family)
VRVHSPPDGAHDLAVRPVRDLLAAAGRGDEAAWSDLVERYAPLVWGVISAYRLPRADAADINQTIWLRLVENLGRIREPAALPGWIVTTTRNECLRVLRSDARVRPYDPLDPAGTAPVEASLGSAQRATDEDLLSAERRQALRDGFATIPARCQLLLRLLLEDPPPSYQDVSEKLRIPVGSVGPTRARCLHKLRQCPALAHLLGDLPSGAAAARRRREG